MTKTQLSPAQQAVLDQLTHEWQSAYDLRCNLATLFALERRGLAERKDGLGSWFAPRINIGFRLPRVPRTEGETP